MEIVLSSLLNGAKEAQGTVVIIDVYRAFTTAAIAFSKGAEKIILVSEIEEALELKRNGIGSICMGEVGGMRPEGFDFGNSPFELSNADVVGKTIIQSTRAGTVGVNAALKAEKIYACSLVIAESTAKALIEDSPELVTIFSAACSLLIVLTGPALAMIASISLAVTAGAPPLVGLPFLSIFMVPSPFLDAV